MVDSMWPVHVFFVTPAVGRHAFISRQHFMLYIAGTLYLRA